MRFFSFRKNNHYQLGVGISSLSFMFGIIREFIILALLGFTSKNDSLQLYLSIFYSIGLTIDAMRLSCLNLYNLLSLPRLIFSASLIVLPFCIAIGIMMNYFTHGMSSTLLTITILGSYFNLIAALLITYKQRNNLFLAAQIINVLPNFILIPGILICYFIPNNDIVFSIICLTSFIPIAQCLMLLMLPHHPQEPLKLNSISILASLLIIIRHFGSMVGEQLLQIIIRSAFFNYGPGYLSVFAIFMRIYAAFRFILIDSYIGSKLASWKKEIKSENSYLVKTLNSLKFSSMIVFISLIFSFHTSYNLYHSTIQMMIMLIIGFYFSTLVRIIYFKINRHENNSTLVLTFASYEVLFSIFAFILTNKLNGPLLSLVWLGYIAKPFTQLLFLRKRFYELETT